MANLRIILKLKGIKILILIITPYSTASTVNRNKEQLYIFNDFNKFYHKFSLVNSNCESVNNLSLLLPQFLEFLHSKFVFE